VTTIAGTSPVDTAKDSFTHGTKLGGLDHSPSCCFVVAAPGRSDLVVVIGRPLHEGVRGLAQAVSEGSENAWERSSWSTLSAPATDTQRSIVYDAAQLASIVLDAPEAIQYQLTGPNGLASLLWNRTQWRTAEEKKQKNGQAGRAPWRWWPLWEVDDVVEAVVHLERAPFVTGEILHIEGGQNAGP
jgi:hypothetical protein